MTQNGSTPDFEQAKLDAATIIAIGEECKQAFHGIDDYIDALVLAAICGQPLIVLGPPGTAKSSVVRYFAHALAVSFLRKVLNPDTKREALFGPIDPTGIKERVWKRHWAGVATHLFVFCDEIGKASGQVRDMLLDAMEERQVSEGDEHRDIPLHLFVSASNEPIYEDSEAVWDRFALRCVVDNASDSTDVLAMLECQAKIEQAAPMPVDPDNLPNLRRSCKVISWDKKQTIMSAASNPRYESIC